MSKSQDDDGKSMGKDNGYLTLRDRYTQREQPFRFGLWTVTNGALPVPFLVIYWGT